MLAMGAMDRYRHLRQDDGETEVRCKSGTVAPLYAGSHSFLRQEVGMGS